ncbi:MAG: hypothetical protein K9N49_04070 [Candidatus Marinimicrobia bacterium]|nr:hypothetical protein [Candidatus Neomarinimicrobiota bacterium]
MSVASRYDPEKHLAKNRPSFSSFVVVLDKRARGSRTTTTEDDHEHDLKGLQRPFTRRYSGCNGGRFSFQRL